MGRHLTLSDPSSWHGAGAAEGPPLGPTQKFVVGASQSCASRTPRLATHVRRHLEIIQPMVLSRGMNPIDDAMRKELRTEIASVGYAKVRGLCDQSCTFAVAAALGEVIDPWGEGPIQSLKPRGTSTPNTYSGIFGVGRFPFHTDLAHWPEPPRYILLRCMKGYEDVPTLLADGQNLLRDVTPEMLGRAIVRPRRRDVGHSRLLRLFQLKADGAALLRWDEVLLKPASPVGEQACTTMKTWLEGADVTSVAMTQADDAVVIDNWRMLHSRPGVPPGREDRHLERVYLRRLH